MLGFSGEMSHPLSFVRINCDGTQTFWAPKVTGDYKEDCATGRRYADELHEYIAETRSPVIVKSVLQAITEKGEVGGVEIGFFTGIGLTLIGLPLRG